MLYTIFLISPIPNSSVHSSKAVNGYDFYNIKFRRYKITATTTVATALIGKYFSAEKTKTGFTVDENDFEDRLTFSLGLTIRLNTFKPYNIVATRHLNNNMFGGACYGNTFGGEFHTCTFGGDCYYNMFGNYCSNNQFAWTCNYVNVEGNFRLNTFGGPVLQCTFAVGFVANTTGSGTVQFWSTKPGLVVRNFTATELFNQIYAQTIQRTADDAVASIWIDTFGVQQIKIL